ncbi:hypothetical protein HYV64_01235 [Candidatus Shapirobacteria bacterium]|nr:hypothetical protein [Candidatus Shapirobacteria bacterium]
MKDVSQYFDRKNIPGNEGGQLQFAIDPVKLAELYNETSANARNRHTWYYEHKLKPEFGKTYDESQTRFADNSGPTVIKEDREDEERIAVQRHFLTGELAFALEENNLYIQQPCIESMCHDLRIFYNRDVFTTKDISQHEWYEMGQRVEMAREVANAMALFQLYGDFDYINPELQQKIDTMMADNIKSVAMLKLTGMIVRDLLAGPGESIINPYFDNPSALRKRYYNNYLLEGIIIRNFPALWIDGENKYGVHNELIGNIKEMAIEAQMWNGIDENKAKKIANTSAVGMIKEYDF